ncbi:MAG: type II toxin-antitoxin system RelE/ParE family toxin [Candidatus Pacebacteria bacterium]|nr:type II toxin-antitoxin system RelE/ParE family toxin [Candidatus Paceibacterota bacterium]
MIIDFKSKEINKIFLGGFSKVFSRNTCRVIQRKLWMLDASTNLQDLRIPPSNRLEKLKGKRVGQHSIRINKKWRICFRWQNGNAYQVEVVDYH